MLASPSLFASINEVAVSNWVSAQLRVATSKCARIRKTLATSIDERNVLAFKSLFVSQDVLA